MTSVNSKPYPTSLPSAIEQLADDRTVTRLRTIRKTKAHPTEAAHFADHGAFPLSGGELDEPAVARAPESATLDVG
jgi:hypothetical protein